MINTAPPPPPSLPPRLQLQLYFPLHVRSSSVFNTHNKHTNKRLHPPKKYETRKNPKRNDVKPTRNRKVRKHFSDLYSLVTPGPSYPFLGVSSTGVGIFWSVTLGLLFGLLVRYVSRAPLLYCVTPVSSYRKREFCVHYMVW